MDPRVLKFSLASLSREQLLKTLQNVDRHPGSMLSSVQKSISIDWLSDLSCKGLVHVQVSPSSHTYYLSITVLGIEAGEQDCFPCSFPGLRLHLFAESLGHSKSPGFYKV